MPRLIITEGVARSLDRCRKFLAAKNRPASSKAGQAIKQQFARLETHPETGRPFPGHADLRELVIPFGDSGYVALYSYQADDNAVYVLAFRHQKEAGY